MCYHLCSKKQDKTKENNHACTDHRTTHQKRVMLPLKQRSGGAQTTSGTRKSSHWICILYLFVLKNCFYHVHVLLIFFKRKGDTGSFSFSPTLQGCPAELTLIVSVTDNQRSTVVHSAGIYCFKLNLLLGFSAQRIMHWNYDLGVSPECKELKATSSRKHFLISQFGSNGAPPCSPQGTWGLPLSLLVSHYLEIIYSLILF